MWWRLTAGAFIAVASVNAVAEETVKVGLILPMTGPFTTTGKQVEAGVRFYMQQNGASVDGKKIELILRDDAGIADNSRRIAQELLVGDKVNILAGFGLTPIALAVAPLATETKTPMVVMAAATAIVTERSPYIVRSSFPQAAPVVIIADWEAKHGLKKVATVVSDFAPGHDSETYFKQTFTRAGGEVPLALRVPLLNPDFAPFLQRVRDTSPDGVFVFIPAGQAATMMRQFVERGLDKSGIRLFGAGDITDDDLLNNMGDVALGIETAYFYSAAHPSEKNKAFVEGVKRANNGMRANFFGVSGYDGMHLIYEAIRKTGGKTDGDSFIGAVKGMSWESPRGPMTIDPETRDVINNIYMRRVERVNGELWNIEFAIVENVKDPVKAVSRRVPFLGSAERTSPGASRPGEPRRGQPHWGVPQGGVDVEREAQRGGPRWGEPQGRPAFIPWTSPGRTSGGGPQWGVNNERVRDVIDTITSKVVLILGRFTDERKAVLDALREELRKRNYLPILFDFEVPARRNITETITLLARMARFIIADLTDPSSIPQELQAIIPSVRVPVQPLLLEGSSLYSMFKDFDPQDFHWVLPVYRYKEPEQLLAKGQGGLTDFRVGVRTLAAVR